MRGGNGSRLIQLWIAAWGELAPTCQATLTDFNERAQRDSSAYASGRDPLFVVQGNKGKPSSARNRLCRCRASLIFASTARSSACTPVRSISSSLCAVLT